MNLIKQLQEAIQPSAYRPTEHERIVVAKILVSTTPQLAFDQIARGEKLNMAKTKLMQLGFIQVLDGEASLTPDGIEMATAQALADETGEAAEGAADVANDNDALPSPTSDDEGLGDF